MQYPIDGFWLPLEARQELITAETEFTTLSFINGRACEAGTPGAVTARWPVLGPESWRRLLEILQAGRARAPRGATYWTRLQAALEVVAARLSDPQEGLHQLALHALPGYTGYSQAMIAATLNSMDMMALDGMPMAYSEFPSGNAASGWASMGVLPGCIRFYPHSPLHSAAFKLPGANRRPLFSKAGDLDLVAGYGAGNVPGTALMIAFLAQSTTLAKGAPPPAAVIKNSRREPIFSALVLSALEDADPDLVAGIAVMVWDYQESAIQDLLLSRADLVLAAAGDDAIAGLRSQIEAAERKRRKPFPTRFHAHGHKVSFSVIWAEVLAHGIKDPQTGSSLLEIVSLLASLDSVFWDQNGCLSSRVHFVETGDRDHHSPLEYAQALQERLRVLSQVLPRGAWPLSQLHERFDRYKILEATGLVQVLSRYDDPFLVILDERRLSGAAFYSLVNDCQGRVIFVRPVSDMMDVPNQYLRTLPPANLQSLSVATGKPGQGLGDSFLKFADSCGQRGVTAMRTVGRGAFPQLSYSWDGLIPMDLVRGRIGGRFTTVEFDRPFDEILATYRQYMARAALS